VKSLRRFIHLIKNYNRMYYVQNHLYNNLKIIFKNQISLLKHHIICKMSYYLAVRCW